MRLRFRLPAHCWIIPLVALMGLASCGGEKRIDPDRFAKDWWTYKQKYCAVRVPRDSPRISNTAYKYGEACDEIIQMALVTFRIDTVPSLTIFQFTTSEDCQAATGRPASFVDGYNIYTRLGAPAGGLVAEAVCTAIDPEARSFPMIRDGARVLFEERDKNIFLQAQTLRAENRWMGLADLLGGAGISDRQVYNSACGSFVGYLLRRHGTDKFKMLWRSGIELRPSVERIYGMALPQLEAEWLAYIEHESKRT